MNQTSSFKASIIAVAVAGSLLSLSAVAQNAVMVNNKAITKAKVDEFVAGMVQQGRPDNAELRNAVRDELIARELFLQEAEKRGLARSADVTRQLEAARIEILSQALIRDELKKNPIKDADLKAEYDKVAKQGGDKQYKTRHILVEKEETAKKIIEDLKKGAKFEDLAKQSKDPGSAQNGGDLDWTSPAALVKPFADVMVKLEKGKVTETPVQTQFGWHVIRVDDVRDSKPPAFEEIKPQITQELNRRKVAEFVQKLRAGAKIQ